MPTAVKNTLNDQIVNAPTGRWGEVADEVVKVEPYEVTEGLIIQPMTRRRDRKLKQARAAYMLSASKLAEVTAEEDGVDDQAMIDRIEKLTDEAEREYDVALFGSPENVDAVYAYFDDQPAENWDAFYNDIHNKLVHRIRVPEDACSKCGRPFKDEDGAEAGKGRSSSTSSTATGTKSKATSSTS